VRIPIAAAVFDLSENKLDMPFLAGLRRRSAAGQKTGGQQALREHADEISSVHVVQLISGFGFG